MSTCADNAAKGVHPWDLAIQTNCLSVVRSGFEEMSSQERVAAVNRLGPDIIGRAWKMLDVHATSCSASKCQFSFMCDCSKKRKQYPVDMHFSGATRTWTEVLQKLLSMIETAHVGAKCSLTKRPANWLAEQTEKKARTESTEKLRTEEEQIRSLSKRVHSLEKSLDNTIDEAEVTRRKEMPIDPTNHEGFDYPTAEGASRFGPIRARAQNTEHSMRALIRCVFHSMHMYSHGISMYVCHRQTEQRASLQRDCPSKEI